MAKQLPKRDLENVGLGVTGAAVATAISYVVGGIAMFLAMLHNRKVSPRGLGLRLDRRIMGAVSYTHLTLPTNSLV